MDKKTVLNFLEKEWQNEMVRRDTRSSNWKSPYEIKEYLDWLSKQETVKFFELCDENGKIVGAATVLDSHIKDFIVKFEYRRKGYGVKLMNTILKTVKNRPLFLQAVPKYQKFYESLGFKVYGYDKSTYDLFMKIDKSR